MADEFDDLKRAFEAATPEADPLRKRENIARAEEIFAGIQGSGEAARLTPQKGRMSRLLDGAKPMMNVLTSRAGLTASTALVAVGMLAILPDLRPPTANLAPGTSVLDSVARTSEEVQQSLGLREERADAPAVVVEERSVGAAADDATGQTQTEYDYSALEEFYGHEVPPESRELWEAFGGPPTAEELAEMHDGRLQIRDMLALDAPVSAPETSAKRVAPPSDVVVVPEGDAEAFPSAPENTLKVVTEEPVSTFSIDVDTASYGVVRSSLTAGRLPPKDAVRVEEMVNYFPYAYPAPDGAHPFQPTISVVPTPWNDGTRLVHIGIQGEMPAVEDRPALNLVFLIDTSGSMQDANKLPLLKQSFRLMLSELRPEDEVSIVTYAGSAGQVLEPTRAAERSVILDALDRLEAGGSTAGQAGLQQAYQVAEGMAGDGEVTRVILATDGDFNVGLSDPEALKDFIADKRESGTYLSVLGFGRGNLDDATMQALAQNGNGQAAYIDTLSEARKVLVDQLTGALFPIANDVKIQVEFNPAAKSPNTG